MATPNPGEHDATDADDGGRPGEPGRQVPGDPAQHRVPRGRFRRPRAQSNHETDLAEYLLSPFDDDELLRVDALVAHAAQAVKTILEDDIENAMKRFNNRR